MLVERRSPVLQYREACLKDLELQVGWLLPLLGSLSRLLVGEGAQKAPQGHRVALTEGE